MSSLNKAQLIGRLGADPELKYTGGGEAIANLSLATSERWRDKQSGEQKEATEWHRVSMFGKLAEIAGEYLKKGSLIYVEGKITTRKWTDKDGVERYTTEIRASEMKMLGSKDDAKPAAGGSRDANNGPRQQQQRPAQGQQQNRRAAQDDDDIPF